jgi:AcrR family transcriptional regulator
LPRAQRVGDIEAAARVVFSRRGFAAASIAEIAAEAGVAEGTIYKFFDSKRHLVVRVIEGWYDGMLAEFERSACSAPN